MWGRNQNQYINSCDKLHKLAPFVEVKLASHKGLKEPFPSLIYKKVRKPGTWATTFAFCSNITEGKCTTLNLKKSKASSFQQRGEDPVSLSYSLTAKTEKLFSNTRDHRIT